MSVGRTVQEDVSHRQQEPTAGIVPLEHSRNGTPVTSGFLVLITGAAGAALMSLEIVGSRVLAPYFGNSVFVWGSLISVFLTALSAGYYLGGLASDRWPSLLVLNALCAMAACLILALPLWGYFLCEALVRGEWPETTGALLASTLLFLPPSLLLGTVSPFSVRLAARSTASIGRAAGTLYAVSTVGSIAGTLATTFFLIPRLGVTNILRGIGGALLGAALVASLVLIQRGRRTPHGMWLLLGFAGLGSLGVAIAAPPQVPRTPGEVVLVDEETSYHHITVVDTDASTTRLMKFDKFIQGGISLDPPYASVFLYSSYFQLPLLLKPRLRRVLIVGAGVGVTARQFVAADPETSVDLVDIDSRVLETAREHFHLHEGRNIRSIVRDGRMYLMGSNAAYDCIVNDAFTIGGRIPFHLTTREYFRLCSERMVDDGMLVMNVISAVEGTNSAVLHGILRTISSVFAEAYLFPLGHGKGDPLTECRNVIILAVKIPLRLSPSDWQARAARCEPGGLVSRSILLAAARDVLSTLPDCSGDPVFTDEYAPVETLPLSVNAERWRSP